MGWTRWFVGAVVGLVVFAVVVWGVGSALPVEHTASVADTLDAAPEAVWSAVSGVDAFPGWRSGVTGVERLPDREGMPSWREEADYGPLVLVVEAWEPPRRLVARVEDPSETFGGTWTYELAPAGAGTELRLTEDGEVYSPVFRFVSRYLMGHDRTMRIYLDDLRAHLGEAGPGAG